ncbi:MAG: cell division protein FtsQ/DivIB [Streptosporangiaceae bacterium]
MGRANRHPRGRVGERGQRAWRGRPGWRLWGPLAGGVAVLAVLCWVVFFSRILAVSEVQVVGDSRVPRSAVVKAADIRLGAPLARVDLAAVADRVAGLRRVAEVDVHRRWPGTVRIGVTEREPVAAARVGSGYVLYDRDGVSLDTVRKRPRHMPVLRVGDPSASDPTTRAALAVVSALPDRLAAKVRTVSADGSDEVRLRLRGGAKVEWGSPRRSEEKARALSALLKKHADLYNVSSPDVVTTR